MIGLDVQIWYGSEEELRSILSKGMDIEFWGKAGDNFFHVLGRKKANFRTGRKVRIDKQEVQSLRQAGFTHKKIAEKLNCSRGYVTKILNDK